MRPGREPAKAADLMASTAVTRQRHLLRAGSSLPTDLRVSTTGKGKYWKVQIQ